MQHPITANEVVQAQVAYYKDGHADRGWRLGQYLMNTLVPQESNPTIFYEKDATRALALFVDAYVEDVL